jgi:TolB-like protein/cytochrome c-type biogenesis protein CcmH/NrfG
MRVRRFLAELKQRRVARVAVVYAAASFAVLQTADIIQPALGLPVWTLTLLVVLTLLGFPIALILAWAFEVTPEGVKRDTAAFVSEGASEPDAPGHRLHLSKRAALATAALLLIAVLTVVGSVWWVTRSTAGEIRALAVLPLANLTGDPEQEYFVDGLHDILIGELAGITELTVISRTSVHRYRDSDKSIGEIAGELGVDALIEGSVFRAGDTVRINVQLVRGSPEDHLWNDRYEGRLSEALDLQTRVAEAIAREVRLALSPREAERLARRREVDPAAQEAYYRGRGLWWTRAPDALGRAVGYLEEAVSLDPEFALAWSGLADVYTMSSIYGGLDVGSGEAYRRAEQYANRALELDPNLAEAHAALAGAHLYGAWDMGAAERGMRHALELNPNFAQAHNWLGDVLVAHGSLEEALASYTLARDLDPFSPLMNRDVARVQMYLGRCEAAIEAAQAASDLDPSHGEAYRVLRECHRSAGRLDEAADAAARHVQESGNADAATGLRAAYDSAGWEGLLEVEAEYYLSVPSHYQAALKFAELGWVDETFDALFTAVELREGRALLLKAEPIFVQLHSDPRWEELLRRAGY